MIPRSTDDTSQLLDPEIEESTVFERLKHDFRDLEYRHGYVEAELAARLAAQIRRLREDRGWTQKELAERAGTKQSAISKLEDPGYGRYSLSLLFQLAKAFDIALDVGFVAFSAAAAKAVSGPDQLSVQSFDQDAVFDQKAREANLVLLRGQSAE